MRLSSDLQKFRTIIKKAKHVAILTGAGISAESGIPTFRGNEGSYVNPKSDLNTLGKNVLSNPQHMMAEVRKYRSEFIETKSPNPAHLALSKLERRLTEEGRRAVVITQNVDDLHERAGSQNVNRLHGSLFESRCLKCHRVRNDTADSKERKCKDCGGLLRPNIVWFGELLDPLVLMKTEEELGKCDMCLLVGTSSVVYPAAKFAPEVAARGVPVAEFNVEPTHVTELFDFFFPGPCTMTLPPAINFGPDHDRLVEST